MLYCFTVNAEAVKRKRPDGMREKGGNRANISVFHFTLHAFGVSITSVVTNEVQKRLALYHLRTARAHRHFSRVRSDAVEQANK